MRNDLETYLKFRVYAEPWKSPRWLCALALVLLCFAITLFGIAKILSEIPI